MSDIAGQTRRELGEDSDNFRKKLPEREGVPSRRKV